MEKRKLQLLKILLNNCSEGYKVLEVSKIYNSIKKYRGNFAVLEEDLNFLKTYKYIDLKYVDENNLCYCVLDNTRIFQENLKSERGAHKSYLTSLILNMLFSGLMAFAGAFIAIILCR